ncbi:MAG: NAD(P)/FAD-dependent oxidoreductase, partial [Planctomycetota bacterium]
SMAIIGKNKAIASVGRYRITGLPAWVLWAGVHVAFLVGFRNRLRVLSSWAWSWLLNSHDARLITGDSRLRIREPQGEGFEPTQDADTQPGASR